MSIYRIFLLSGVLLCTAFGAYAQSSVIDEDLGKLSLHEAKNYLKEQVEAIGQLHRLAGIRLVVMPGNPAVKEEFETPFMEKDLAAIQQDFDSLFRTVTFRQKIDVPHSVIEVKEDWDTRHRVRNAYEYEGQYQLKKIFFRDGTTKDFNEVFSGSSITLENIAKPIERIELAVKYDRPGVIRRLTLDQNTPKVSFPGGSAELKSINGGTVDLLMSGLNKQNLAKINGLNTQGKVLFMSGNNTQSLPSEEMMKVLDVYRNVCSKALDNFGSYKNTAELKKYLEKEMQPYPVPADQGNITYGNYHFRGNVATINIYLKEEAKPETRMLTLSKGPAAGPAIARNSSTKRFGLLDNSGKWIMEPSFDMLEYGPFGFFRGVAGGAMPKEGLIPVKDYALDKQTNTLKPLPFELNEQINEELILVERETNGPYGIYNLKTEQLVLPMNYVNVKFVNDLLTCRIGQRTYATEGKYGGFTIYGKSIVPAQYDDVETDGNYFYTNSGEEEIAGKFLRLITRNEVFDRNGRKINPDGQYTIGGFIAGQPILTITKNEKYGFIDSTGKKVIDASQYDEVEPFSNGMAIVKKGKKSGAINLKGELTVPLLYDNISRFQERYALVQNYTSSGYKTLLIDKRNLVVKEFKGHFRGSTVPANANSATYNFLENDRVVVYDADGKRTEK